MNHGYSEWQILPQLFETRGALVGQMYGNDITDIDMLNEYINI